MQLFTSKRDPIEVNLTPLIDIVFLLLIFFMVSTTFTKETRLILELPEASGEPSDRAQGLEITVGSGAEYSINGYPLVGSDIADLLAAIANASDDPQERILLTADQNASHGAVVKVLDALAQLGFANIQITTRAPDE